MSKKGKYEMSDFLESLGNGTWMGLMVMNNFIKKRIISLVLKRLVLLENYDLDY